MNDLQRFNREDGRPCPICGGGEDDPRGEEIRCAGFITARGERNRFIQLTKEQRTAIYARKDLRLTRRFCYVCLQPAQDRIWDATLLREILKTLKQIARAIGVR
ncbi:MAG: hypothetical protein ACREMY_02510 [bacterium]